MKIYVICDLEGTAGVMNHKKQCLFDGEYYHQAREWATMELIKEKAEKAMFKINKIEPFFIKSPYTIRTQFYDTNYVDQQAKRIGVIRIDDFTVELKGSTHIDLLF